MEAGHYFQLGIALLLVLGLMGLFGFILKKVSQMQSGLGSKNSRLAIVEQRMIDSKSKIVLVRCDQKEHLILMSQNSQIVLDTGLKAQKNQPGKTGTVKHETFD